MSSFKKGFRDNVVAPYNKYNLSQEKLGEIIDTNKNKKTCTVSYKNVDGIKVVAADVPVKSYLSSMMGGFPKSGDFVELQETGKAVRIISIIEKNQIVESEQTTGDIYSNGSSYGGNLGV